MVCINGIIGAIYVKHFKKREVPKLTGETPVEQDFGGYDEKGERRHFYESEGDNFPVFYKKRGEK